MSTPPVEPNYWLEAVRIGGPLITAFGGGYLAFILQRKQNAQARHIAFVERQLSELYGPLRAHFLDHMTKRAVSDRHSQVIEEKIEQFGVHIQSQMMIKSHKITDYEVDRFYKETLPMIKTLDALFKEKTTLADPELITLWPKVTEFIDLVERQTERHGGPLIHPYQQQLDPVIEHVERRFNELQAELRSGKVKA